MDWLFPQKVKNYIQHTEKLDQGDYRPLFCTIGVFTKNWSTPHSYQRFSCAYWISDSYTNIFQSNRNDPKNERLEQ